MKRLALVLCLAALAACSRGGQSGSGSAMQDTSHMMMSDSAHAMMSDTSKGMMMDTSKMMKPASTPATKKP
jgi:hypothetical protein